MDQIMKSKASVLLIEQDEGLRQLLLHILRKDYQVMTVETIIDAWRYLLSNESLPNLLIIDLDDVPLDSRELVKQIKANGILREIPIIALCSEQALLIFTSIEVDEMLSKPFDPKKLKEKIIELTLHENLHP